MKEFIRICEVCGNDYVRKCAYCASEELGEQHKKQIKKGLRYGKIAIDIDIQYNVPTKFANVSTTRHTNIFRYEDVFELSSDKLYQWERRFISEILYFRACGATVHHCCDTVVSFNTKHKANDYLQFAQKFQPFFNFLFNENLYAMVKGDEKGFTIDSEECWMHYKEDEKLGNMVVFKIPFASLNPEKLILTITTFKTFAEDVKRFNEYSGSCYDFDWILRYLADTSSYTVGRYLYRTMQEQLGNYSNGDVMYLYEKSALPRICSVNRFKPDESQINFCPICETPALNGVCLCRNGITSTYAPKYWLFIKRHKLIDGLFYHKYYYCVGDKQKVLNKWGFDSFDELLVMLTWLKTLLGPQVYRMIDISLSQEKVPEFSCNALSLKDVISSEIKPYWDNYLRGQR